MTVNQRLIFLIGQKKITQAEFSRHIEKSRQNVNNILQGQSLPSFDFLHSVLVAFPEVDSNWLMRGEGEMYRDKNKASPAALIAEEPQPIYARAPGPDLLAMQQRLAQLEEHIRVLKLYLADKDKLIAMLESEVSRLKTLS